MLAEEAWTVPRPRDAERAGSPWQHLFSRSIPASTSTREGSPQSWLTHTRRPTLPKKGDPLTPTTARWAV